MKAITIQQPWASAILWLGKDIENRTWWRADAGGELLLHAGKSFDPAASAFFAERGFQPPSQMPYGAIVGSVTVTGVHNSASCVRTSSLADLHPGGPFKCSLWAMGGATGNGPMFHWELGGVQVIDPVPCRGGQQIWTVPDDTAALVRQQLARAVVRG